MNEMNKVNIEQQKCKCPYCEEELKLSCFEPIFCIPCNIKFVKCKKCGKLINEKSKKCPYCDEIL